MALFGSSNPFLKEEKFKGILDNEFATEAKMTVSGAVNKSLILTGLLLFTATIGYVMPNMMFLWVGGIGGLIAVLVASFKPHLSSSSISPWCLGNGTFPLPRLARSWSRPRHAAFATLISMPRMATGH